MDKTEMLLTKILQTLSDIRDELSVSNKIMKRSADQQISESKTRQRSIRRQMMITETSKR